jgi:hypothetical protein
MLGRERESRLIYIEDDDIKAIIFRNFAGNPDKYHKQGTMPNFWIVLTDEKAEELIEKGLNVREKLNRDGDPEYRLQVFVRFDNFPPTIIKICGNKQIKLDEEMVADLDRDEIEHIDLAISPYHYQTDDRTGVKAYLNKGYFTILQDLLDYKYADDFEE